MFDGDGLYLLVSPTKKPNRGKAWRFKYFFDGKEKLLSLDSYPEISLADARSRRDQARKLIANGIDPAKEKQRQKLERAE